VVGGTLVSPNVPWQQQNILSKGENNEQMIKAGMVKLAAGLTQKVRLLFSLSLSLSPSLKASAF
jgi:hypothetical protein